MATMTGMPMSVRALGNLHTPDTDTVLQEKPITSPMVLTLTLTSTGLVVNAYIRLRGCYLLLGCVY